MEPIRILLVEDNPGDAKLAQIALSSSVHSNEICWVTNANRALDVIHQNGDYSNEPRPDLIILDLNLPGMPGLELLEIIKGSPEAQQIPVLILSSSDAPSDVLAAYNLNTNCYIKKPFNFDEFSSVVNAIDSFWLSVVTLPRGVK